MMALIDDGMIDGWIGGFYTVYIHVGFYEGYICVDGGMYGVGCCWVGMYSTPHIYQSRSSYWIRGMYV